MPLLAPRPTVFVRSLPLSRELGVDIVLASETFQYAGSFKYRAAHKVVTAVASDHLVAASSGNFGLALALAASQAGKRCTIVMPRTSARVKVEAIRECGAHVDAIDVSVITRRDRLAQVLDQWPDAHAVDAAEDWHVIEGNATLGVELATCPECFDDVVAPIGGGGLLAGLAIGLSQSGASARLTAAEPLLANDTAQSFRAGRIVELAEEPPTLADGARVTRIGELPWSVLRGRCAGVVEVCEPAIISAMRLCFSQAHLKVEPTAALALAAVMSDPAPFRGRKVCCVVTGANVDPELYLNLMSQP